MEKHRSQIQEELDCNSNQYIYIRKFESGVEKANVLPSAGEDANNTNYVPFSLSRYCNHMLRFQHYFHLITVIK